jgi:hypothetical protein
MSTNLVQIGLACNLANNSKSVESQKKLQFFRRRIQFTTFKIRLEIKQEHAHLSVTVPSTRARLSEAAGHLVPHATSDAQPHAPLKVSAFRSLRARRRCRRRPVSHAALASIAFRRRRPPASPVRLPHADH